VRKARFIVLLVAVAGLVPFARATQKEAKGADDSAFLGTWSGTWTGGSGGTFEMTVSKDASGKLSGSITPSPNNGSPYTSPFRSVVVENGTLTATFDPPDGEVRVTLTATVEGGASKGTYEVYDKNQGGGVESGTWTAKKK
jgi:hypothetical protein